MLDDLRSWSKELRREQKIRESVYPGFVRRGNLTENEVERRRALISKLITFVDELARDAVPGTTVAVEIVGDGKSLFG